MHKFTLLFIVVCAIVAASAVPVRKTAHKKSAKLRHAPAKSSKLVRHPIRKNGKMEAFAHGHGYADVEETPFADEEEFSADEYERSLLEQEMYAEEEPQVEEQLMSNNYFSTHFGQTHEGAIALANSYSAGKSGSAQSHATSYGTH